MSNYGYTKQLNISFVDATTRTIASLKEAGFGVLTEIDAKATLKQKLDIKFDNYLILGICNPGLAYQALQVEKEIGLLLPCNVIVYESEGGVFISALMPTVAMSIVDNPALYDIARQAEDKLRQAIDKVL